VFNATIELLMDAGDGAWRTSGTGTEPMHLMNVPPKDLVFQCGDAPQGSKLWAVSSFQLQMASGGTARFGLRVSGVEGTGSGAVLELRKVGAAVVGTGWDRMFAEPTAPVKCSGVEALESQMGRLERELARLSALK